MHARRLALLFWIVFLPACDANPPLSVARPASARMLAEAILRDPQKNGGEASAVTGAPAELLKRLPAAWDETRQPSAPAAQVPTVIRRHREDWFVGIIGPHTAQPASLVLDFLEPDRVYIVHQFVDGTDRRTGDATYSVVRATSGTRLAVTLGPDGGAAFWITPDVKRR